MILMMIELELTRFIDCFIYQNNGVLNLDLVLKTWSRLDCFSFDCRDNYNCVSKLLPSLDKEDIQGKGRTDV